jgi:tetratricopeptide (TPR) repeat protein
MRSVAVVACLLFTIVSPLSGQRKWVGPQSPCDIKTGFFRLNSVVVDLQKGVEQPPLRERMLSQALDVLVRSIRDDKQEKNPAAWYYLGRYYAEMEDGAGADSAFARAVVLAPQCKADIDGYRSELAEGAMNRGLAAWQRGDRDSAAVLLRQSYALDPSPKPLFQLGSLYLDANQPDSAVVVLRAAAQAAGDDAAYATAKQDALVTVARVAFARTQTNPAVQKWQHTRYSRDSLGPYLVSDSTILARMQQSSASRRARRARLSPADQRAFSTDSTARANAVARDQATREVLVGQAAADSAAVQLAYAPAIAAYRDVVAAYPANADAATALAAIYSQAGRKEEATAVFDGLFTHSADLSARALHELGLRLVRAKMLEPGTQAYVLLLQRNPYQRDALAELTNTYLDAQDTANALATAQRLQALDPLNKAALGLVGRAWELKGRRDSAEAYRARAEAIPVDITIASMVGDSSGVTLTGVASNLGGTASKPFRIMLEFVDVRGAAVESQGVDIPALDPGGSHQFQVRGSGTAIVGWRYRQS